MTIEERLAAKEQLRKKEQQFREILVDSITENYGFGEEIAKACVDKGWEDGHSAGYIEVRTQAEIAADFAEKILKIIGRA
jgi:flagellar biosynthesis/type III secretory pathway protein FliH